MSRDTYGALMLTVALLGLYFIPTFVAFSRNVVNRWSVLVINALLGWTFIGWVVALAMAARTATSKPSET